MMLNRPAIFRLFAAICLMMVLACSAWAGNITPVIGNSIMGGTDIVSDPLSPILMPDPIFVYQPDRSWISAHASGLKSTTYARTSAQTYVDRDGVLRIAPANTPAIGRYGVELQGASTNLIKYSYDLTRWTASSATITDANNATISAGGFIYIYAGLPSKPATGDPLTGTVELYGTGSVYINQVENGGAVSIRDMTNSRSEELELSENEPTLIRVTSTFQQSDRTQIRFDIRSTAGATVTGFRRGAQSELNSVATAYTPTNGTAATTTTSAANTSGNGLQVPMTQAMIDCFSGGNGTLIQWVYLPYASSAIKSSTTINVLTPNNAAASGIYITDNGSGARTFNLNDGTNTATVTAPATAGLYGIASKLNAATGKMIIGYITANSPAVNWGTEATYDGAFPIYSTDKNLRWFYGGTLPLGIGGCALYNTILTDDEIIRAAQALQ